MYNLLFAAPVCKHHLYLKQDQRKRRQRKFYVTFVGPIWLKFEVCMMVVVVVEADSTKYEIIHPDCST